MIHYSIFKYCFIKLLSKYRHIIIYYVLFAVLFYNIYIINLQSLINKYFSLYWIKYKIKQK